MFTGMEEAGAAKCFVQLLVQKSYTTEKNFKLWGFFLAKYAEAWKIDDRFVREAASLCLFLDKLDDYCELHSLPELPPEFATLEGFPEMDSDDCSLHRQSTHTKAASSNAGGGGSIVGSEGKGASGRKNGLSSSTPDLRAAAEKQLSNVVYEVRDKGQNFPWLTKSMQWLARALARMLNFTDPVTLSELLESGKL